MVPRYSPNRGSSSHPPRHSRVFTDRHYPNFRRGNIHTLKTESSDHALTACVLLDKPVRSGTTRLANNLRCAASSWILAAGSPGGCIRGLASTTIELKERTLSISIAVGDSGGCTIDHSKGLCRATSGRRADRISISHRVTTISAGLLSR